MSDIFEVAAKAAYKASIENATDPALNWENIPETSREYWRKIAVASSSIKFDPHDLPEEIEVRVKLHRRRVSISSSSESQLLGEVSTRHNVRVEYATDVEDKGESIVVNIPDASLETMTDLSTWMTIVKLSFEDKVRDLLKKRNKNA